MGYIRKTEIILSIRVNKHQNATKEINLACKQGLRKNLSHHFGYSEVEVLDLADNTRKLRFFYDDRQSNGLHQELLQFSLSMSVKEEKSLNLPVHSIEPCFSAHKPML